MSGYHCVKSVCIRSFSSPNAGKYGPEKLQIRTLFYAGYKGLDCSKQEIVKIISPSLEYLVLIQGKFSRVLNFQFTFETKPIFKNSFIVNNIEMLVTFRIEFVIFKQDLYMRISTIFC